MARHNHRTSREESAAEAAARRAARVHAEHVVRVARSVRLEAHRRGVTLDEELDRRRQAWPGRAVWDDVAGALGLVVSSREGEAPEGAEGG